jgi:Protein of unknown function (DUF1579)
LVALRTRNHHVGTRIESASISKRRRKMRFVKLALVVLVGLSLASAAAYADEKKPEKKMEGKMEMPKPGPEAKKLGYFTGNWKSEGELKENPFGMPPGKFTSLDKCDWFTGGFHVVCHSTGKGSMGPMNSLGILAYNADQKGYTYYGIDNMGMAQESKGTVEGDNWVYTSDMKVGDKTYHGRYTIMPSSPNSYTSKYETSEDGQNWTVCMEMKSTKIKAEKKAASAETKAAPAEKK